MAEQELTTEQLEVMYPNMRAYIRAARKRGYTPADIDEALTAGITARRKAGKSLQDINTEYGISTPESKGIFQRTLEGFTGGPNLEEGRLTPEKQIEYDTGMQSQRQLAQAVGMTGADLGERIVGPPREAYKTYANAAAVRAPRALASATDNDTLGAVSEALMRGLVPGVPGGGFPGTEAANALYEEQYPNMDPLLRQMGPSKLEMGVPVPQVAGPALSHGFATVAPRLGRFATPAAILGELGTVGGDFIDGAPGAARALDWSAADQGTPMAKGSYRFDKAPEPIVPRGFKSDAGAPIPFSQQMGPAPVPQLPQVTPKAQQPLSHEFDDSTDIYEVMKQLRADPEIIKKIDPNYVAPPKAGVRGDPLAATYTAEPGAAYKSLMTQGGFPEPKEMQIPRNLDLWRFETDKINDVIRRNNPGAPKSNVPQGQTLGFPDFLARTMESIGPEKKGTRAAQGGAEHYKNWLKKNGLQDSAAAREEFFKSGRGERLGGAKKKSVGGAGVDDAGTPEVYGLMKDDAFVKLDPSVEGVTTRPGRGIPYHTARPDDIPRSQSLAKVPGNEVVDSTRMDPGYGDDINPHGQAGRYINRGAYLPDPTLGAPQPVDARGQVWGSPLGPAKTGLKTPWDGQVNSQAFPDRLPMGDRQGELVRPTNRYGEELDVGKMRAREAAAQQRMTAAHALSGGRPNHTLQNQRTLDAADLKQGSNDVPGLQDLAKRREFDNIFDKKFTTEFSAGPGGQFMRDMDNIANKALAAIQKATAADPRAPELKDAIRSFQKMSRLATLKSDEIARGLVKEISRMKKAGAPASEIKEFQTLQFNYLKSQLKAQTTAFRSAYVKTAKNLFPNASTADLLAEAGEVEALQNGLALSPWTRAARAIGVGTAKSVGVVKTIKVLGSSTAYANNVGSNLMSTVLGGGSITDVKGFAESVQEFRKGSDLYNEALEEGLFGTEFFAKQLDDVFRELELAAKDGKSITDIIEQTWRKSTGSAAKYYDGIDKVFKFHMYKQARTKGVKLGTRAKKFGKSYGDLVQLSTKDAVEHINRYFPNYENLPQFIQRMRKNPAFALAANPFLAFPVEFSRIYKNAAQDHPLRFFGAAGGLAAAVAATASATGDRPDYHKFPNKVGLAIPFTDDGTGKPRVVDLTYMIPLADTFSGEAWRKDKSTIDNVQQMMKNAARNTLGRGFLSPQDEKFQQPGAPDFGDSLYRLATERSGPAAREFVQQGVPNLLVPPVAMKASQVGQKRAYGEDPGLLREAGEFVGVRVMPDSKVEKERGKSEFRGRLADLNDQLRRVQNQKQLDPSTRRDRERRIREQIKALKQVE